MKLLYITTRISGAGGMQRVLSVKTGELATMGYEAAILTTNADEEPVHYRFHPAVALHTITPQRGFPSYFFSYRKHLNAAVARIKPDVIIMADNGLKGFLLPYILSGRYPLVYERHGSRYIEETPVANTVLNRLKKVIIQKIMAAGASRFDKVVVLTGAAKEEWPGHTIEVIPNPLWFSSPGAAALTNKVAIAVGRHTYEKGYDRLFKAWKAVVQEHPDWLLRVYGDSNPDYDVKALAVQAGVENHVQFLPPQADIVAAYKEASICLMASRSEGFGMVLLEAMACGVPCVAFDCPVGPAEIISNGTDGFLVKDGDTDAYADKVNQLIKDETLRRQMGTQAKESSARFGLAAVMKRWDTLFRQLKR